MPKTRKPYKVIDPAALDPRGGPRQLLRAADSAGFIVEAHSPRKRPNVIAIGGVHPDAGLAFVALWVDGKSTGATLYSERDEGYREVPAPKTELRGRGVDRKRVATGYVAGVRLVYNGGPRGISLGVNDLKARLAKVG